MANPAIAGRSCCRKNWYMGRLQLADALVFPPQTANCHSSYVTLTSLIVIAHQSSLAFSNTQNCILDVNVERVFVFYFM